MLSSSMPATGRLLPTQQADGHTQMALDAWLLKRSNGPALRFYRWDGPWLSLGRHQRHWPEHWNDLARRGRISLVRRPSGGRAVLHAGGLTYALVWPDAPRQRQEAYRQACQWLINGFEDLGLPLRFGADPAGAEANNCFATATVADLVDPCGVKRVGRTVACCSTAKSSWIPLQSCGKRCLKNRHRRQPRPGSTGWSWISVCARAWFNPGAIARGRCSP